LGFVMAKKIRIAHAGDGFTAAIIYGPQRLGKTSYAAQVLYEIYGDWDEVLKYTVFDLKEVVELLSHSVKTTTKLPAICWDDCGVHANKMLYFSNRGLTQYLTNLVDVVGISLGGLLMTTPSPSNLLKALRGYEFYRCKVFNDGGNRRHATGYLSSLLPSGSRIISREFTDYYNVMLPPEFWYPYKEKRNAYLTKALGQLEGFLEATPAAPGA